MPFKSEKQRRYLWANEPEIARDWTDTYGSRIKKDDGGIMRVGLQWGGPGSGRDKQGYQSSHPSSQASQASHDRGGQHHQGVAKRQVSHTPHSKPFEDKQAIQKGETRKELIDFARRNAEDKEPDVKQLSFKEKFQQKSSDFRKRELRKLFDYIHGGRKFQWPGLSAITRKADWDKEDYLNWKPTAPLYDNWSGKDLQKLRDLQLALGTDSISQAQFDTFYPQTNKIPQDGGPGGGGYMGYPSYAAWLAAQGKGGTTEVAEVVEETPSDFQASLTTGTNTPGYYVGNDPTASNIAWGKKFGADPRTMGMTSYAADGGRIPAAFGGIMDTATGRRAYGLGSIFKKIGRAAKKVLKSPIGRGALMAGLGAYGMGWGPFKGGKFGAGFLKSALSPAASNQKAGWLRNMFSTNGQLNPWKIGIGASTILPLFMGGEEEDESSNFDYEDAKTKYWNEIMGIKKGVAQGNLKDLHKWSYLPSNYRDGGRIGLSNGGDPMLVEEYNKYVFEMKEMGLEPMSFEQFKEQARAGMYAGGQSTPSDYTMEDAIMTTTQDKLGGITDVMKQADLNRQGSVGQFYAADGGRIGYNKGGNYAQNEVANQLFGTSFNVLNPFQQGQVNDAISAYGTTSIGTLKAQGGRIGYDAGGQTGHPPITMGQPIQAPQMPGPQAPQSPMPAPQPNPMAMMNPMMGGRRMAQEGGLMDLGGMEKDYRNDGGFVPLGGEEKADDVPARLSKNEFVFTADAVRGAGDGDIDKGAEIMENVMKNLEQGGQVSEDTQGLAGAQEMFSVSERLSEVV